jgi:membrane-associated protease RseP (regulator of RpoE activity)
MGALGQVSFFVALILVVLVHEAAHFGVAKAFRIKVTEFFVGFGPRLWSIRRGETEYGVKAIPAGGYVKIAGMNPYEEIRPEDAPRTYGAKPAWQRALVIVAGPLTHLVLAFVCFAAWLGFVGQVVVVPAPPTVGLVEKRLEGQQSPAAAAGLRAGDRIVAVDGIPVRGAEQLTTYTRAHVDEPITLTVDRRGRSLTFDVTPVLSDVDGSKAGRIGVLLEPRLRRETAGPVGAVTGGAGLVGTAVSQTVRGIGQIFGPEGVGRVVQLLFTNEPRTPSNGGPLSVVGVSRVVGQTAESGHFWDILYVFALVNVFIGLVNLLPLPPFDGGHLALLVIEKVRGRTVDMRRVVPVSAVVVAFFVLFTLSVVYLDIVKPVDLFP